MRVSLSGLSSSGIVGHRLAEASRNLPQDILEHKPAYVTGQGITQLLHYKRIVLYKNIFNSLIR